MSKQREGKLVVQIRLYLERAGAMSFKIHGGDNPFQEIGIPDLLCCYRGRFIGLEVKLPGEKPSPRQRYLLDRIKEAGGIGEVVTSVKEVRAILKQVP